MTDYIRRDEALSFPFANGQYDHKHANEHFIFGCESYKEWLEGLPTADVRENVHGRWSEKQVAYKDSFGDFHFGFKCSECGAIINKSNFCGNCGAIMDGGDEQ